MKEKLFRFMAGRNGNDALNRFLLGAVMVLLLLGIVFSKSTVGRLLMPIALVLLGFTYFRMFSKNIYRRYDENTRFLQLKEKLMAKLRGGRGGRSAGDSVRDSYQYYQNAYNNAQNDGRRSGSGAMRSDKEHRIFRCPNCDQRVRVPRGRGKIEITCPRCGHKFIKRS